VSSHLYRPAYQTRLGNLTAKSVLVRICDQANDTDGLGWPSEKTIAVDTETHPRTVARMLQVFDAMGLVKQLGPTEVNDRLGRRVVDMMQVDLGLLGKDLTKEFAEAFAAAQGKDAVPVGNGRFRLRDRRANVSETEQRVSETETDVSETKSSVSETKPPHPLNGGTLFDPCIDPSLNQQARAFTPEQQEHLDRLAAEGKAESDFARNCRRYYAEKNAADAEKAAAEQAEEQKLREEFPDRKSALAKVRKRCGFAWAQGDELGPILEQVFRDQQDLGKPVWRIASQMIAMWELQRRQGERLRARFGPVKFYRDGHWLDPQGWHWNAEVLAMERKKAEAGIGSGR